MHIKYNISNVKRERKLLNVISSSITTVEDDYHMVTLTTKTPHNLQIGDIIVFNRDIINVDNYTKAVQELTKNPKEIVYTLNDETVIEKNVKNKDISVNYKSGYYWNNNNEIKLLTDSQLDVVFDKYNSLNDKIIIEPDNFSEYTFSFSYKKYKTLYTDYVFDGDDIGMVHVKGRFPSIYNQGDVINIRKRTYSYQYERDKKDDDFFKEIDYNPSGLNEYLGVDRVIFLDKIYVWKSEIIIIECNFVSDNYFSYSYDNGVFFVNDVFEIEDTRFINNEGKLHNDILFYEYKESLCLNLPLSSKNNTDLNNDDISKKYFEEKKNELISNITDYEKRCFTPYYNQDGVLKKVSKINFNLFFRDRTGSEDWNTSDVMGWNQYKILDNGSFSYKETSKNGDLLGVLDFTDEDVYYRKKKVSKTFIRLSFYDTNNPLNQMLLFYSTIFLDSGDLYEKYIKNIDKKIKNENISLVNDNTLGNDNLTVSFNVCDRYNRSKSSEGFYLYLFPDGIDNNKERTIYMKVEFNHAGYGKTIPMIYPNNGNVNFHFTEKEFPTSLINADNGSLKELYRQLYIPLTIKYDKQLDDYVYYFDVVECKDTELTINLYEPKINPLT